VSNSISLDDLVVLNDEIAGLVRAGVPLELGLASWSRDVPGQLGRTVAALGAGIEHGQSLPQSLDAHVPGVPPVYAAIVRAGLKSGRLPSALESLARSARNLKELRGVIGMAVLYPLVLILLTYFLILFFLAYVTPALLIPYDGSPPRFWAAVNRFGEWTRHEIPIPCTSRAVWVAIFPPLVVAALAAIWWLRTRRAMMVDMGAAGRWLSCIPVAGAVVRHAKAASLAEILGLLVEHDVPLGEAIVLAAECTADRRLLRSAREVSTRMALGTLVDSDWKHLDGFPPLVCWIIASGGRQQTLTAMARHVADTYRRRALRDSQWLRDYLPMWLIIFVGGLVAGLYALMLFVPFTQLMEALSGPTGQSMRIRP
jgi:general secretion pathway protein F